MTDVGDDLDRPSIRRRAVAVVLATVLGVLTALFDAFVLVARGRTISGPALVARAVRLECSRIGQAAGVGADARPVAFLGVRAVVGLAGGLIAVAGALGGLAYLVWPTALFVQGELELEPLLASLFLGAAALVLSWQLAYVLLAFDRWLARQLLGPDPEVALQRRVAELSSSRADVVDVVDGERRRIERDLHDGVQQRVVALGVLLGRARRTADEGRARELVVEAHHEVGRVLADLREVVWRVYPAVLDQDGLVAAVSALAERAVAPVHVHAALAAEPPAATARAAYFVVSEGLSNAAKHATADHVDVYLEGSSEQLVVRVVDDGCGGADPSGGGLSGLARRVAAIDGTLAVTSPAGGPTELRAVLPCG